ncbi:unnamed protein product [Schistosoma mattheei]|uniref:Uncharacterized protein n=1 Tax=Schistosoma mattheei TaxID=31246 RepID=A0A183P632_9TREM|nr:unnamed protein product [Schistosoma mattheei]
MLQADVENSSKHNLYAYLFSVEIKVPEDFRFSCPASSFDKHWEACQSVIGNVEGVYLSVQVGMSPKLDEITKTNSTVMEVASVYEV